MHKNKYVKYFKKMDGWQDIVKALCYKVIFILGSYE